MKKIQFTLLSAIISVATFSGCGSENKDAETKSDSENKIKTDVESEGLKGKVKTISQKYFAAVLKDGKAVPGEKMYFQGVDDDYEPQNFGKGFDEKGKTVFYIDMEAETADTVKYSYDANGEVIETGVTRKYDERKNLIEEIFNRGTEGERKGLYKYNDADSVTESSLFYMGKLSFKSEIKYGSNKYKSESTYFGTDGQNYKSLFKYNSKNSLIEMTEEGIFGHEYFEYGKRISRFDEKGRIIEFIASDKKKRELEHAIYTYDKDGNSTKVENSLINGKIYKNTTVMKYDANKKLIEESMYDDKNTLKYQHKYKYDTKGNEIEQLTYDYHGTANKILKKYDENGNLIEILVYDKNEKTGSKSKWTYTYDENGNWTEWISYDGEKPNDMYVREIKYY